MVDSSAKTFRLRKGYRWTAAAAILLFAGFTTAIAIADGDPIVLLFLIPILWPLRLIFSTALEISDHGIKYSDGALTIAGSWQEIERIFDRGLLTREPALTYKKWAAPLVWRMRIFIEPRFARLINLRQFERNWLEGEIGEELSKHIPQLVADYRRQSPVPY